LKKVVSLFCPGEARETSQIFSRTYKQNSRTFQDSKNSRAFPGCGNPESMNGKNCIQTQDLILDRNI